MHKGRWIPMFSHIKLTRTKRVIKMGTKLYNKMPVYIKEMDDYKALKKELKSLFVFHAFYSEAFVCL
jgi:hypothetical protein